MDTTEERGEDDGSVDRTKQGQELFKLFCLALNIQSHNNTQYKILICGC